jgi:hypothetical protein
MRIATVVFLVLSPATVWAQQPLPEAGEATGALVDDSSQSAAVTEYDFEPDKVTGSMIKPDELKVVGRTGRKTSSLIHVRTDFVREVITSVDEI